jgi:RNA polymerase sigma factor (sigma-70 family)
MKKKQEKQKRESAYTAKDNMRLAQLEESLWWAILGNRAKRRSIVARVFEFIRDSSRYGNSAEISALAEKCVDGGRSENKDGKNLEMGELISRFLEMDADREIVSVALAEATQLGRRRRRRAEDGLSLHATEVQAAAHEVMQSRNALIESNQGLVVSVANRFANKEMPFSDRVQEGNLGLMKAVNRFDHRMGYRFSTYASWWIRATIRRAIREKENTVRVPLSALRHQSNVRKAAWEIQKRTGHGGTEEEIAREAGIDPKNMLNLPFGTASGVVSLDQEIPGSSHLRYIDCIADENAINPVDEIMRRYLINEAGVLLVILSPIEREVIEQRFGFGYEEEGATLREIGNRHNLSRERIRQIQNNALKKMRVRMKLDAA